MTSSNEALIRTAYDAYVRGDLAGLLELVHPELEWTYLDPSRADPPLQTCHGRGELEAALRRQTEQGLSSQLEEVRGNADRIVVGVHTPGIDERRQRKANDRNYDVFTIHDVASPQSAPAMTEPKH